MGGSAARHPEYREDQREIYDHKVVEDSHEHDDPRWIASRRFEVRELFRHVQPRTVLDVGCGSGLHDLLMAEQQSVEHVLAVDYSEKSVQVAQEMYPHPAVDRRVADVFSLEAGPFDLVVSFQVIEHVPDAQRFLAACGDLAAPGAAVAVFTPNRERLPNRIRRLLGRSATLMDEQHAAEYTIEDIVAMGRQVGLAHVADFSYGLLVGLPRGRELRVSGLARQLPAVLAPLANRYGVVFTRSPGGTEPPMASRLPSL